MSRSRSPGRLRSPPLYRLLNRFSAWKRLSKNWRSLRQSLQRTDEQPMHLYRPEILRRLSVTADDTLLGPIDVADCIRRLRDEGFWPGLQLPTALWRKSGPLPARHSVPGIRMIQSAS